MKAPVFWFRLAALAIAAAAVAPGLGLAISLPAAAGPDAEPFFRVAAVDPELALLPEVSPGTGPESPPAGEPEAADAATLAQVAAAQVLALACFLVLIAGLLLQWGSDASCREERSVFDGPASG